MHLFVPPIHSLFLRTPLDHGSSLFNVTVSFIDFLISSDFEFIEIVEMGFKGFSSYIKKKKKYFQDFKLSSSILVIDGNNLASVLYRQASKSNFIFNGDYDVFAEAVSDFFAMLLHFKVEPLVILDGGYELRKLNAIQARLLHSTREIARLRKEKNSDPFLPLLIIEVFKEVMLDMNVKFAQSRYEADTDIVEIAKYLACPILSSDSDYYFCDAGFIPFSSLKFPREGEVDTFISCKIFTVEPFLEDFGGLPDKSFQPLLALLLGDYMEIKHFKKLYLSLLKDEKESKKFKLTDYDRLLRILCSWFWELESLDAAVSKIEESVSLQFKRFVRKQLKLLLEKELNPVKSPLIDLLCNSNNGNTEIQLSSQLDALKITDVESQTPKLIECLSPTGKTIEIPEWFIELDKRGSFSRQISNILNLRSVFLWTQLESFDLPSVYTVSFPILRAVAGITLSTSKRKRSAPLTCYVRTGCDIGKELLIPNYPSDSVSLNNLNHLPLDERQKVLLDVLQIHNFSCENLPREWSLFFLSVIFWLKHKELLVGEKLIYVGAFVLSFLLLGLAAENQLTPNQYHSAVKTKGDKILSGTKKSSEKPACNEIFQTTETPAFNEIPSIAEKSTLIEIPHIVENPAFSKTPSLAELKSGQGLTWDFHHKQSEELYESQTNLTNCSSDAIQNTDSFKHMYQSAKNNHDIKLNLVEIFCRIDHCELREIDRIITHFYAELQTILQCVMMLNSVLNFPFPQTIISKSLSGSLIFKLVTAITKSSSLTDFIDSLNVDPVIRNVFLASLRLIEDHSACSMIAEIICSPG